MNCGERDLVGDLMFGQQGTFTTDTLLVIGISNSTGICWSSDHSLSVKSCPPRGMQCAYSVANVFLSNVAT